ncbi:hypothetical protein CV945_11365 [Geobacillus sp. Manikaran-105]|nr:hypothetical protein A3Q36_02975 [Geobacillus stearothermophilus]PJW13908.1 hypothetical protein CV945_11365 [Geobacillus sp. Manikaran-105]PJW16909.1 hypothetical protein CV944_11735 [Geobacillus sp. WSUCF-018B]
MGRKPLCCAAFHDEMTKPPRRQAALSIAFPNDLVSSYCFGLYKPCLAKKVKGAAAFCNETNVKNNCFFGVTNCYKKDKKSKRAVCKKQP